MTAREIADGLSEAWQPIETVPSKVWVIGLRAHWDLGDEASPAWIGQKYDMRKGGLIDWRTGRWVVCSHWAPIPDATPARAALEGVG